MYSVRSSLKSSNVAIDREKVSADRRGTVYSWNEKCFEICYSEIIP